MLMKSKQTELRSFANPAAKVQHTAHIRDVSLHGELLLNHVTSLI